MIEAFQTPPPDDGTNRRAEEPRALHRTGSRPLCVDLDGTLVRTDLLVEGFFALIKRNLLYIFLVPLWLYKGKAHLKEQIARRVELDAGLLPYHEPFLEYLIQEHAKGRSLILATSANTRFAEAVAGHLGIFDGILASDPETNLTGRNKLARLRERFGEGGFDYAGNSRDDCVIFPHAGEIVLVSPERGVRRAVERQGDRVPRFFGRPGGSPVKSYLRALRPHQWLKNLLVFVPLLASHGIGNPVLVVQAVVAFIAFSLCASSVYLLNDLLDLPADRAHRTKRHRPFASGDIAITSGAALIPLLLACAVGVALLLPPLFLAVLAGYYAVTLCYSLWLKRSPLIDVLVLAGLYTVRVIGGAAAVSVQPSFWLLGFSMFVFLSLALVKRYTELAALDRDGNDTVAGRGYRAVDLETLSQFGISSAYIAVLVLAFYIHSESVTVLYSRPEVIWLLCPLLLYLLSRIWLLARREDLDEDPVVFVIRDRRSQWLVAVGAVLVWLAI